MQVLRSVCFSVCFLLCGGSTVWAEPPVPLAIKASTDRVDALYKVGELATFSFDVSGVEASKVKELSCVVSEDGFNARPVQKIEVKDGVAKLTAKLDKPGFLLVRASVDKVTALVAAGFDPLQIPASMPVPADFDEFWAKQKQALRRIEARATLTPVKAPAAGIEAFDAQVECLGAPVSGYFGRPENAKPKSLPAILFVHGAGVRSSNLGSTHWALREGGMLAMDINAHGIPNGKPAEFYDSLSKGDLKDYRSLGRQDRETCYFKGMFLRVIRAIDFLTSQPEWDGKTLIVFGSSQGGFQAFAAGGLDERVTYFCAGVPAGCDHTGAALNRISGWPKIVPVDAAGKSDPQVMEVARYFDCVNFASRAKCRGASVSVGFIDTTCPPTSVYAAYNRLGIPKAMHVDVLSGHTSTPGASEFLQAAALKHVRDQKSK